MAELRLDADYAALRLAKEVRVEDGNLSLMEALSKKRFAGS